MKARLGLLKLLQEEVIVEKSSNHERKGANVRPGFNVLRRKRCHTRCLGGRMTECMQGVSQATAEGDGYREQFRSR